MLLINRAAIAKRGWVYRPRLVAPGLGSSAILAHGPAPLMPNKGFTYPRGVACFAFVWPFRCQGAAWGLREVPGMAACRPEFRADELCETWRGPARACEGHAQGLPLGVMRKTGFPAMLGKPV